MAIELLRHHPPDQQPQLLVATRLGQRGPAQVVGQVEVRIVHPDRPAEGERDEVHPLPVAGDVRQVGLDAPGQVVVGRRRALEDRHRADVHVADGVLEMQERGVLGAEALQDFLRR